MPLMSVVGPHCYAIKVFTYTQSVPCTLCKYDKSSNMLSKLTLYLVLCIVSSSTGNAEDTRTKRRKFIDVNNEYQLAIDS